MEDWASLVFVRVYEDMEDHIPCGYLLISKPQEFSDQFYSLPGGHRQKNDPTLPKYRQKSDETPFHTAVRELLLEAGLRPELTRVRQEGAWYVEERWVPTIRRAHRKFLFSADITLRQAAEVSDAFIGEDGEIPKYFSIKTFREFARNNRILPGHYEKLCSLGLIIPQPSL